MSYSSQNRQGRSAVFRQYGFQHLASDLVFDPGYCCLPGSPTKSRDLSETVQVETPAERIERWEREDDSDAFKRSGSDPEFTAVQISEMTGISRQKVYQLLVNAKVGRKALREQSDGIVGWTRVVRYTQLMALAREFGWFGVKKVRK